MTAPPAPPLNRSAAADRVGAPAGFPPSRAAALARVAAIDLAAYARTRNRPDGAVTRLSPYLTHGVLTVPEVLDALRARGATLADKLVFELGWREYWQHAWRHLGDALETPRRPAAGLGAAPLPDDVRGACTGVRVIDAGVAALYRDGWLHNHARLWLAGWLVHERGVDWRAGAAWLHGHLLDGDLAANTLSWQWVAGTYTGRPYRWSDGNVAHLAAELAGHGAPPPPLAEPALLAAPPWAGALPAADAPSAAARAAGAQSAGALAGAALAGAALAVDALALDASASEALASAAPATARLPADPLPALAGRRVALVHPWMLRGRPAADVVLGILHRPYHARYPWSAQRWAFVTALLRPCCDVLWVGDLHALAGPLAGAAAVSSEATLAPGYREALTALGVTLTSAPRAFPDPDRFAPSFSAWWQRFAPPPRRR